MKKLATLGLLLLLPLSACSDDGESKDKAASNSVTFSDKAATVEVSGEVDYIDVTYKGKESLDTVWLQAKNNVEGSATIDQCLTPWEDGKCAEEPILVLPKIDLGGWKNSLATANTPMITDQTRYLRFTMPKDSKVEFSFSATNETPAEAPGKKKK